MQPSSQPHLGARALSMNMRMKYRHWDLRNLWDDAGWLHTTVGLINWDLDHWVCGSYGEAIVGTFPCLVTLKMSGIFYLYMRIQRGNNPKIEWGRETETHFLSSNAPRVFQQFWKCPTPYTEYLNGCHTKHAFCFLHRSPVMQELSLSSPSTFIRTRFPLGLGSRLTMKWTAEIASKLAATEHLSRGE